MELQGLWHSESCAVSSPPIASNMDGDLVDRSFFFCLCFFQFERYQTPNTERIIDVPRSGLSGKSNLVSHVGSWLSIETV